MHKQPQMKKQRDMETFQGNGLVQQGLAYKPSWGIPCAPTVLHTDCAHLVIVPAVWVWARYRLRDF